MSPHTIKGIIKRIKHIKPNDLLTFEKEEKLEFFKKAFERAVSEQYKSKYLETFIMNSELTLRKF